MFKDFLKKAEEKAKEYTKKTKDYVESDEFKNRVNTIKEKTTAVAKDWEEKGKKAVSDFKEKRAAGEEDNGEVVEKTEETTVTENENGKVVEEKVEEEKVEETVVEKESEEASTEDVVDKKEEVETKESDVVEKKSQ